MLGANDLLMILQRVERHKSEMRALMQQVIVMTRVAYSLWASQRSQGAFEAMPGANISIKLRADIFCLKRAYE